MRRTAILLLLLAAFPPLPATEAALTEEEIVRMFVAGASEREILDEIARREADFDVSTEMLEELRRVDLPETVIEAMVRRQSATTAAPAPPVESAAPVLRVRLNPDRPADKPSVLRVREAVDPQLAAEWELGNGPGERTFAGIALYLACVAEDHVPHQWRSRSPLGRDFVSTARHHMLAFEAASRRDDRREGRLELHLPQALEVEVEPGEMHDLVLGVALQINDRYYNWISDARPGVTVGPDGLTLSAVVKGKGTGSYRVRFERPAGPR